MRKSGLCGLTFELSGRQRQDARPGLAKMYRVPPDRAWWRAVGAPLERGVRRRLGRCLRVVGLVRQNDLRGNGNNKDARVLHASLRYAIDLFRSRRKSRPKGTFGLPQMPP